MPRWWLILRLRLRSLFRRSAVERDLDDELQDHLTQAIDAGIASGLTPDAARTAALRGLGGLEPLRERVRDARRTGLVDHLLRDVRHGLRVLRHSPSFTAVAILSLALGIGANAAIFQLVDAVRLRALPVTAPGELAIVRIANRDWPPGNYGGRYPDVTYPIWEEIRTRQQVFTTTAAWGQAVLDLASRGESRFTEDALWVSGDFFAVFGVRPALGRLLAAGDDVRGCPTPGVVLSHAFWQRSFGGNQSLPGSTLLLNGHPFVVLGVSEPSFTGPEIGRAFDLAIPLCADSLFRGGGGRLDARREWWLSVFGRLKPGVSIGSASAHLRSLSPAVFEATAPVDYPAKDLEAFRAFQLEAVPGGSGISNLRDAYDSSLWLLLTVAGIVLLIACANLANMTLARLRVREREMAVRLALGASRWRLIGQLLVESLLLALAGAVVGAALAPLFAETIVALMSTAVEPLYVDLSIDARLVLLAALLAMATTLLFGLAPARRASRVAPIETLRAAGGAHTGSRRHVVFRRLLVVVQIALSLVLLVGGLLFSRSLFKLFTVDVGFEPAGVLEVDIDLTRLRLEPEALAVARTELLDAIRALPDVQLAGSVSHVPLVGAGYRHVFIDLPGGQADRLIYVNRVSPGYFEALKIARRAGRDFEDTDTSSSPLVAIVNDEFVGQFLDGPAPIGTTFQFEGTGGRPEGPRVRIVGVVGNTKYRTLRESFKPIVYTPERQDRARTFQQILLRTSAPLARVMPAVTAAVSERRPQASFHYHDFREQLRYSLRQDQVMALLCGVFAALAVVLAATGVYGVQAYSVSQRSREIGIRLALGASHTAVRRLVLGEGVALLGIGLLIGLGAAAMAVRGSEAWLFGLEPRDPIAFAGATLILAAVAIAASSVPARRATRIDPVRTLKME